LIAFANVRSRAAGRTPILTGHHYQGVHVDPGAKAHVGNTYNISQFLIDIEEEYH
jgi:hypothetical protein